MFLTINILIKVYIWRQMNIIDVRTTFCFSIRHVLEKIEKSQEICVGSNSIWSLSWRSYFVCIGLTYFIIYFTDAWFWLFFVCNGKNNRPGQKSKFILLSKDLFSGTSHSSLMILVLRSSLCFYYSLMYLSYYYQDPKYSFIN